MTRYETVPGALTAFGTNVIPHGSAARAAAGHLSAPSTRFLTLTRTVPSTFSRKTTVMLLPHLQGCSGGAALTTI